MNPLAKELNDEIERISPDVAALLSERGKKLYWPRGILFQSAEAREKAHRFNATLGEATEDGGPMSLGCVLDALGPISPADALRYAPASGRADLRRVWREKLVAENPTLAKRSFGTPIVTSAITHGLSIVGDLFVDPGDRLILPDKLWGNYRLTFETRLGAVVETYPTYANSRFNAQGLAEVLGSGEGKAIVLLNFPNNPTGYMPGRREVEELRDVLVAAAESGRRLVVVVDDAYFGLVFDDLALQESAFGFFANLHPRILTIKLDAATKELFVWGLRCGFLTYAPPPVENAELLLAALEKKTMGAIRGAVSSSPHISQSVVLQAMSSPEFDAQRKEKLDILRRRATRVREVVDRECYRDSWDVYPFNAGYFMCLRIKGVDAEKLRVHLLERYGVGLISLGAHDLRVAFSCLEEQDVEPLFQCVHDAIVDLKAAESAPQ